MNVRPGMEVAILTDVGRVRDNNEDSYLYWEPEDAAEFQRKGRLAIIADGMGGYEGGQEASRLAVETVRGVYEKHAGTNPQIALMEAFSAAHEQIRNYGEQHPEFYGMGTTCTALAIIGTQLHFAHVGDSRLYLVRQSDVSRLTRDHSYVSRLVESGIVRSEDAENHPQRHILTAALGSGLQVAADVSQQGIQLADADTLVLCTDGLWSLVHESEISAVILGNVPAVACRELVKMALQRGGPDNITVLVLRFGSAS